MTKNREGVTDVKRNGNNKTKINERKGKINGRKL
jgi:hypothetical protein